VRDVLDSDRSDDCHDVAVVRLDPDQWPALKDLRLRALRNDPRAFAETYERAAAQPDELWKNRLLRAREGAESWLWFARQGDRLVGMVGAFVDPTASDGSLVNVVAMYVDAAVRRRGVGRRLLTALIDELQARGVRVLQLAVNETQHAALALYTDLGFQIYGQETLTMGDSQIYVEQLMRREL